MTSRRETTKNKDKQEIVQNQVHKQHILTGDNNDLTPVIHWKRPTWSADADWMQVCPTGWISRSPTPPRGKQKNKALQENRTHKYRP